MKAFGWCVVLLLAAGACNGDSDPDSEGTEPPVEFVQACRRFCGLFIDLPEPCEPGQLRQRGVTLGGGEPVPAEPPLSDDPACNDDCITRGWVNRDWERFYDCWQQLAAEHNCSANATLMCGADGGWGFSECGDHDRSLCEK